jgi:hypothetical protein
MKLAAQKQRCMLASLPDGAYFAMGPRSSPTFFRRSYGKGGEIVGLRVAEDGTQLAGDPERFANALLTMVYPATPEGGAR